MFFSFLRKRTTKNPSCNTSFIIHNTINSIIFQIFIIQFKSTFLSYIIFFLHFFLKTFFLQKLKKKMKQNHFRIFGVRSIASSRLRNGNFLKSPTNTSCQLFRCLWLKGLICGVLTLYMIKHVRLLCLESSFNCSLTRGCKSHLTELSSSCYRLFYRNGGRGNTSRRRPCHFTFWIWRPAWWLTSTSMWWILQGRLSLGQLRPLTWTNLFSTLCVTLIWILFEQIQ